MKIYVCVKQVPDTSGVVAVNPDGTMNRSKMPTIINPDDLNAMEAALLTLSLNTAAFFAVLVHSSIIALPKAQWEAGYALGFNKFQIYINIIAKQAIRLLIPQAITLYISQLQCSSLVSFVSLMDLAKAGQQVAQKTMLPFLIFGIVAAIYFVISYPLAQIAKYLEKHTGFTI